jgi:hypothetical protein
MIKQPNNEKRRIGKQDESGKPPNESSTCKTIDRVYTK